MLTFRLLGVPSVLALASLAPLALAHDVVDPATYGTGSGAIVMPNVDLGEIRGTLIDATGKSAFLLRARLEAFPVFWPGSRLGALEGQLYDARSARLVATVRGSWDEAQGRGHFEAEVHPVGVPDPHHFVIGNIGGDFVLQGGVAGPQRLIAQPEQSPAQRAAAMRLKLRAEAMRQALAEERAAVQSPSFRPSPFLALPQALAEERAAVQPPSFRPSPFLALPFAILPRVATQRATAPPLGDIGYFLATWEIDGLR